MNRLVIRPLLLSLLLVALAAPARSQGQVLEVGSAGPYFTLQSAVDAAADGDTILANDGSYGLSLVGRSLTVVAAQGEFAFVSGAEIRDLQPGDVVVLRGLKLHGLTIANCHGTVWVEDCVIDQSIPALRVESSTGVVFVRDTITGPFGWTESTTMLVHESGDAAHLTDSVVEMLDCTVAGGAGQSFAILQAGGAASMPGDDAIELHGGQLRLCGGSVTGGAGGNGGFGFSVCVSGSAGGHGLRLLDGNPQVVVRDSSIAGGAGGTISPGCQGSAQPGAPGSPLDVESGLVSTVPGTARHLELSGPVTEHTVLHVVAGGVPGDAVLLLVGLLPGVVPKPPTVGTLLVPDPILIVSLGVLGNPATLDLPIVLPDLGPHVPTVRAFVQGAFKPASGGVVLGSGSVLIALDSSF